MQELMNITNEMEQEALKILSEIKAFREKYNIKILHAESFEYSGDKITIFDNDCDDNKAAGFHVHYITNKGIETKYIEHDRNEG